MASFTMSKTNMLWYPLRLRSPARSLLFRALLGGADERRGMSSSAKAGSEGVAIRDTLLRVHLPFKTNPGLFADYANIYGGVRMGKILEDLDAIAAAVAFMVLEKAKDPEVKDTNVTMVTAAVDHIDIDAQHKLITNSDVADLRLSAVATFSSHSSLEVSIYVEKHENGDKYTQIARANFIMVSRTLDGGKRPPHPLPALTADTREEKALLEDGIKRNLARKAKRENSLEVSPPTAQESAQIHALLKNNNNKLANRKPSETVMQTTRLCQPQERNIHGRIFGGYLMREAFELAVSTALLHQRSPLEIMAIDDIAFVAPVEVGSILNLQARIVFTDTNCLQVRVQADVIETTSEEKRRTTNVFFFTFVPAASANSVVRPVLPETYQEAMDWLQAQRRILP